MQNCRSVTADQNIHNMRSRFLQQSRWNSASSYFTILKVLKENVRLTKINIRMIEVLYC